MFPEGPHHPAPDRGQVGFSLIELMFVMAIMAVVGGMAVPILTTSIANAKADSASVLAQTTLARVRDRAIAERRNFELHFDGTNRIRVERVEVPGPGTTTVEQITLESEQVFTKVSGLPDTPDRFAFNDDAVQFTGTAPVMFTSDGSFIDANGDVVNGTVFLAKPGDPSSVRAITILGVTGLIRSWKWSGTQWIE